MGARRLQAVGRPQRLPTLQMGIKQLLFGNRVRALPGPEYQEFSAEARDAFWRVAWQLSPQSNRMGYRLLGSVLQRTADRELLSHGVLPGVVQVPPPGTTGLFALAVEIPLGIAGVELARTGDFQPVVVHFFPVGYPADSARHGENDREHG